MPSPKKISEFKPLVSRVAQTSHYEVMFGGLHKNLYDYLSKRGVDKNFITREAGILCSSASLPGSLLGTADITGNRMGISEKMVHTRIYTDLQLEFYVDDDYKMMKFFEHWMEFASGGSDVSQNNAGYFYRMRFPNEYKCDETKIVKFDRTYKQEIEYTFRRMFPINLSSVPVSYDSSNVLKVSATFNYERYIAGKAKSLNEKRGDNSNKKTNQNNGESSTQAEEQNRIIQPVVPRSLHVDTDTTTQVRPTVNRTPEPPTQANTGTGISVGFAEGGF